MCVCVCVRSVPRVSESDTIILSLENTIKTNMNQNVERTAVNINIKQILCENVVFLTGFQNPPFIQTLLFVYMH